MITVVGLGPGGETLTTEQTRTVIDNASRRYVRTMRHPAATLLEGAVSFDDVYERADTFAQVYSEIVDRLMTAAADGDLVYAVPGSPLVLERTVELLRQAPVELEILPALSFLDTAWSALGIDPVETGVHLIDGHRFAVAAAGRAGPLLVAHCHGRHILSDIKLAVEDPPESATILYHLGLPDQAVSDVAWADLDREVGVDHLTSVYIGELGSPVAAAFTRFEELVRTLRDQCPWDREQTHGSMRRHLLEEAHETLEALDARSVLDDDEVDADLDEHLAEELGDLLYQIFFHARLASERGSFTVADVADGIHDKLVARHPHVFGDVRAEDATTVLGNWERLKAKAKGRQSAMDDISPAQPALIYAMKALQRASAMDRSDDPEMPAIPGEVLYRRATAHSRGAVHRRATAHQGGAVHRRATAHHELREWSEHELGDLLFAAVRTARRFDHDPESALRGTVQRFAARVRAVERLACDEGIDIAAASEETLAALWRRAAGD